MVINKPKDVFIDLFDSFDDKLKKVFDSYVNQSNANRVKTLWNLIDLFDSIVNCNRKAKRIRTIFSLSFV